MQVVILSIFPNLIGMGIAKAELLNQWGVTQLYEAVYHQKAGIMLADLTTADRKPTPLFEKTPGKATGELMRVVDQMNHRYGRETIRIATSGFDRPWMMARELLSPSYTTRWEDIPTVQV